jgi:hypothetical protein
MTAAPISDGSTPGDAESIPADSSASRLLRLYPAAYRQVHGEEIAAIHAEAVADAGPWDRLREGVDIASHALRVRLRITSSHRAGQVLAAALPYVLAVLAANSAFRLGMFLAWGSSFGHTLTVAHTLMLVAVVCTVAGRWEAGRLLVLVGLVAILSVQVRTIGPHNVADDALVPLGTLLTGMILAAAPRDLPPAERHDRMTIVKIGLTLLASRALWLIKPFDFLGELNDIWPYLVLFIAVLMVLSAGRSAEQWTRAAGVSLALTLCVAFGASFSWNDPTWSTPVIKLLGVVVLSALVVFAAKRGARLTRR